MKLSSNTIITNQHNPLGFGVNSGGSDAWGSYLLPLRDLHYGWHRDSWYGDCLEEVKYD